MFLPIRTRITNTTGTGKTPAQSLRMPYLSRFGMFIPPGGSVTIPGHLESQLRASKTQLVGLHRHCEAGDLKLEHEAKVGDAWVSIETALGFAPPAAVPVAPTTPAPADTAPAEKVELARGTGEPELAAFNALPLPTVEPVVESPTVVETVAENLPTPTTELPPVTATVTAAESEEAAQEQPFVAGSLPPEQPPFVDEPLPVTDGPALVDAPFNPASEPTHEITPELMDGDPDNLSAE
jgi:hypothetical protein